MASRNIITVGSALLVAGIASTIFVPSAQAQAQAAASGRRINSKAIQEVLQKKAELAEQAKKSEEETTQKKTTLEGELRYSNAKLAAAQKRLAVQTAVNNTEQAEKAQQEISDWEARIKATQAQLNALDSQPKAPQLIDPAENMVLPGENLDVYVVEDPSFNGHYQVRRGGYIIIPQVGRIFVAGKTLPGAESAIKKSLETNQLQHCTVMVEKLVGSDVESGPTIYLAGEFKQPRPFKIPAGTSQTLVSVILSAGGLTDKADLSHVRVERVAANNGVVEEVDVQRILDGSGLASDLQLSDGDVVVVPAMAQHVVYLTGNVKRQGTTPLEPGGHLSVYAAILQNGGFSRFANLKKVYILRATADGSKARIPVNIKAVQKGTQPDVPLESNDIVVVPEKFFSF